MRGDRVDSVEFGAFRTTHGAFFGGGEEINEVCSGFGRESGHFYTVRMKWVY